MDTGRLKVSPGERPVAKPEVGRTLPPRHIVRRFVSAGSLPLRRRVGCIWLGATFDWEGAADGRSVARRGLDLERAVQQRCAFAHAEDPEPFGPCRGVKASAIVSDAYLDRRRSFDDFNDAVCSVAVLGGVGQRLLHDSVDRELELACGAGPLARSRRRARRLRQRVKPLLPTRSASASIAAFVPRSSRIEGRSSVISARRLDISLSSWSIASRTAACNTSRAPER